MIRCTNRLRDLIRAASQVHISSMEAALFVSGKPRPVRAKGNNQHTEIPGNGRMDWLGALEEQSVRLSRMTSVRRETDKFAAILL